MAFSLASVGEKLTASSTLVLTRLLEQEELQLRRPGCCLTEQDMENMEERSGYSVMLLSCCSVTWSPNLMAA